MNNSQMFSRRIAAARPLRTSLIPRQTTLISQRYASQAAAPSGADYPNLVSLLDRSYLFREEAFTDKAG